jgi:S-adenosylmethionine decarboxylase
MQEWASDVVTLIEVCFPAARHFVQHSKGYLRELISFEHQNWRSEELQENWQFGRRTSQYRVEQNREAHMTSHEEIEIEFKGKLYHDIYAIERDFDLGKHYGPHITIDCDQCNHLEIVDEANLAQFLADLSSHIGMKIIVGPKVGSYKEDIRSEQWGLSGFVLIAESHISIHTYPHMERNYALIDIFSCKYFDILDALHFIIERLRPQYVFLNFVPRGSRFKLL